MSKQNLKFLSNFINSLGSREYYPRRWRPGRRRRGNFKMSGAFYNLSEKPMTMGPGTTTIRVSQDVARQGEGQDSFSTMFGVNNELMNQFRLYKYFRIKMANIVVFASNVSNVPSYFMVDWDGRIFDNTRLYRQDGVKMTPGFLTRTKVFTFKPPNMTVNFATGLNSVVNLREWSSIDQMKNTASAGYSFPGYFLYDIPDLGSLALRYELIIELRGNKIYEESTKTNNLNSIKEEDKEENLPKPLFYNSNKEISLKSKSVENKPGLFTFRVSGDSIFGNK